MGVSQGLGLAKHEMGKVLVLETGSLFHRRAQHARLLSLARV